MKRLIYLATALLALPACATEQDIPAGWTMEDASFFPADRTLTHAEDGVVLPDGRLLVGDYEHGLVTLSPDGAKAAFGDMAAAGFEGGTPNGISWEPDLRHILLADVATGAIYRADTVSEEISRIYQHPFGVNAAIRDSTGAIWFTQSAMNAPGENAGRLGQAVSSSLHEGALYRLAPEQVGDLEAEAELKIGELDFANGLVVDEARGAIFVNEFQANRVLGFDVDIANGELGDVRVVADITTPDNLELDGDGLLWAVSLIGNKVVTIDPDSGEQRTVFAPTAQTGPAKEAEWRRMIAEGENPFSLFGPDLTGPMPGFITGIILSDDGGPVYVSGLGDALVRLER